MTNEYTSADHDFQERAKRTYLVLALVTPLTALALTAIGYRIANIEHSSGRRSTLARVLEGLSYMSTTAVVIILVIGILIFTGLIFFLRFYYAQREIVIGLKFNDPEKQLTVTTKRIDGQEFTRTHKYTDLSLEENHLSDGMTSPLYDTLTLVKGNYLAGHIYTRHFTWDDAVLAEIKTKLEEVL